MRSLLLGARDLEIGVLAPVREPLVAAAGGIHRDAVRVRLELAVHPVPVIVSAGRGAVRAEPGHVQDDPPAEVPLEAGLVEILLRAVGLLGVGRDGDEEDSVLGDFIEDEDTATYEYTFKLSHLIDKRAEIKRLTHQANLWAERTGDAIDGILTTSNAKVDRLSTSVSASNALFTYKISFRIDVQNFEKFQESFDTIFNTTGTSVQIKNGDLLIAVPLPKELIVPIDVGSMYREIFGNDEESA